MIGAIKISKKILMYLKPKGFTSPALTTGFQKLKHLRKPYLALPMRGQFEQELNAFWLAKLNYGINLRRTRSEAVGNFLYRLPDFKESLND